MTLSNRLTLLTIILSLFTLTQCDEQNPFQMDFSGAPDPFDISGLTKVELTEGFYYYDVQEGADFICTERDIVRLHFTARLKGRNSIVSSTYANDRVDPALIELGKSINIGVYTGYSTQDFTGLRRGMAGMKEGGKRTIIVPPSMGFGLSDTLQVDVELTDIVF